MFPTLAVVKEHHPFYLCPADGASLWLGQGLVALGAGTHVATLQKDAGPLLAQAHGAAAGGNAAFLNVELTHPFLLMLLELLQHAPLLPPLPVVHILLPQDEEERGTGRNPEDDSQNPPEFDAIRLLPQQGVVVQAGEKVTKALLGGLELDEIVIQHQLSHTGGALSHPQHLLRLMDAFGSLATDEVANDAGQGLDCRVEVLVSGLQVQLSSVEWTHNPHGGSDGVVMRPQGKRNGVGALVDDFLCVVPAHKHDFCHSTPVSFNVPVELWTLHLSDKCGSEQSLRIVSYC